MADNVLYYGDNLDILRRYIQDETVDLVYLDPPFKSNQDYNILFAEQNGSRSAAQIRAFEDTWTWDQESARAYQEIVESGAEKVSKVMQAFRMFLGESDMMAYLAMMAPRLVELRRVMKPTGSIYLHCDPTASHYLKMLMDAVFGAGNFKNEIVWCYSIGGKSNKTFGRKHDVIFWYSKSGVWTFNPDAPAVRVSRKPDSHMKVVIDEAGVTWQEKKDAKTGKVYRYPFDKVADDYWLNIEQLNREEAERLGYPTQKPQALLERIISASCPEEGGTVLDPFCGCGTTIAVAERLKRRWIGIDITHLAVTLIKRRLMDAFGPQVSYKVVGEPVSITEAEQLAKEDPYQFQWWALGMVEARPMEQKKGADRGIDGRLYFHDEPQGGLTKQIILQVKAGHATPAHVRDLGGVVEREKAQIGVLITLDQPTKTMRTEAASAGFYNSPWNTRHPRIQIIAVSELLAGRRIDYPPSRQTNVTFKKARKVKSEEGKTGLIPFDEKE
jgi:DNA modification methylase